jgi:hypothetical protein
MPGLAAFAEATAGLAPKSPSKPRRRRVPGIHVLFLNHRKQDVDGRDKPGHDESGWGRRLRGIGIEWPAFDRRRPSIGLFPFKMP